MTANNAKTRKAKGVRLEKHVSDRLNDVLGTYGVEAKRMPLSGAVEGFEGDVYTNGVPITIECKNTERHNVWGEWEQAETQGVQTGLMPVLVMGKNHLKDPKVMINFEDFLFFLEMAIQNKWVTKFKKGKR